MLIRLRDPAADDEATFGPKLATLARLARVGFRVPPGFCLPAMTRREFLEIVRSAAFPKALASELSRLLRGATDRKVIVRSSALLEGSAHAAFPGVFRSIGDVDGFDSLLHSLKACMASLESQRVRDYGRLTGVHIEELRMAILVQRQIEPVRSGAASGDPEQLLSAKAPVTVVEMVEGRGGRLLRGGTRPIRVFVRSGNVESMATRRPLTGGQAKTAARVEGLLRQVSRELGSPQLIEWAQENGRLFLLQARPITRQVAACAATSDEGSSWLGRVLPDAEALGLKAAAMQFFVEAGLFTKRLKIFESGASMAAIARALRAWPQTNSRLTVRFSHGEELGLPRFLAETVVGALRVIREARQQRWTVIVHDYIDVRHSFELQVESEKAFLEHVPGLWESSSHSRPDMINLGTGERTVWRWPQRRRAVEEDDQGWRARSVSPVGEDVFAVWMARLERVAALARKRFRDVLPINLHCVAEELTGDWEFLNVRRAFPLGGPLLVASRPFRVRNTDDLRRWDGSQPIVLIARPSRGEDAELIALVEALQKVRTEVYVEFGLLSHPAMLLRDLGITPRVAVRGSQEFRYAERNAEE